MKFQKTNNMDAIRESAIMLLKAVSIEPNPLFPILCSHPFTSSVDVPNAQSKNDSFSYLHLTNETDYQIWEKWMEKAINEWDVSKLFAMTNEPYRLTMLKYTKEYMDIETFSNCLEYAWVSSENPNGDVNCHLPEIIRWFKAANKKYLMDEEDYKVWANLPETITVYRGVAVGRKANGLSWTPDYKKAEWFAHRYDTEKKKGYVKKATIPKEYTLAYFNTRNEDEIVVDISKIKKSTERI